MPYIDMNLPQVICSLNRMHTCLVQDSTGITGLIHRKASSLLSRLPVIWFSSPGGSYCSQIQVTDFTPLQAKANMYLCVFLYCINSSIPYTWFWTLPFFLTQPPVLVIFSHQDMESYCFLFHACIDFTTWIIYSPVSSS